MIVRSRHTRRDPRVDQIRPSEQVDETVAGRKVTRVCHSTSFMRLAGIAVTDSMSILRAK